MSKKIEDFYIKASGEVLTDYLPEDWQGWEDEDLNEWVEKHAWEPYEWWSAKQLWKQIASVAHTLMNVYNSALEENNDG